MQCVLDDTHMIVFGSIQHLVKKKKPSTHYQLIMSQATVIKLGKRTLEILHKFGKSSREGILALFGR